MWQAVASIAGLISALTALCLGVVAIVRSGKDQQARERAEGARETAAASEVGLKYLKDALALQQDTIVRQEGEIGELRGQLRQCREHSTNQDQQVATMVAERQDMAAQLAAQAEQIADLQARIT